MPTTRKLLGDSWILFFALACSLAANPASAALQKYRIHSTNIAGVPDVTPNPNLTPDVGGAGSVALVDGTGASPVLRKLLRTTNETNTALIPGLAINIFTSTNWREGPGATALLHGNPAPSFTGTGTAAPGNTVRWGTVTGWTLTGQFWCNSNPALICALLGAMDEVTTEPLFNGPLFDLGTWSFHGTGFTATPYVTTYATTSFGNLQNYFRGERMDDVTVPIAGIAVLGLAGALVVGARTALRRGAPRD